MDSMEEKLPGANNPSRPSNQLLPSTTDLERRKKITKKNEISTFINKTFKILEDKENSDAISWTDNGNSFIVKNKEKFESLILPKYFKHRKFSSFVRQLNMYDFHKLRKEKEIPIFRHKYFKMNRRELLKKIHRKCVEDGAAEDDREQSIGQKSEEPSGSHEPHQDQLEQLARENTQLYKQLQYLQGQYSHWQDVKSRQREKCLKVINCLLYMNLENSGSSQMNNSRVNSLHGLVHHIMSSGQEPLRFDEYRDALSEVYTSAKERVTGIALP